MLLSLGVSHVRFNCWTLCIWLQSCLLAPKTDAMLLITLVIWVHLGFISAFFQPDSSSHLQITEVMPRSNMLGTYSRLPWVEVTNLGRKQWNLTNSIVKFSPQGGNAFRVYNHILLDPYESAVLHGGLDAIEASDELQQAWSLPDTVLIIGTRSFSLDSIDALVELSNTSVSILDPAFRLISAVSWTNAPPRGVSLQFSQQSAPLVHSQLNVRGSWYSLASSFGVADVGSPGLFIEAASDIRPGPAGSKPHNAVEFGGNLVLAATNSSQFGVELHQDNALFKHEAIADIWKGNESSSPADLTVFDNAVFFTAASQLEGRELWVYRGMSPKYFPPSIRHPVIDLLPGPASSNPADLVEFDSKLFFVAETPLGRRELHFYARTGLETGVVENLDAFDNLVLPGGPGFDLPESLFVHHASLDALYGTSTGRLVFTASTAAYGREIYVLDPGSTQPQMLVDLCPGPCSSSASDWFTFEGDLYFSADDGTHGRELWVYRGGFVGTGPALLSSGQFSVLLDIEPGAGSSDPSDFAVWQDNLVFLASTSATGRELFMRDAEGALQLLAEVREGTHSSEMESLITYNAKLYMTAVDSTSRRELYIVDGQRNVQPVYFRPPRGNSSEGSIADGTRIWQLLDELLWVADDGATGPELHKLYTLPDEGLDSCATDLRGVHFSQTAVNVAVMQLASHASCAMKLTLPDCAGCKLGKQVAMDNDDLGGHVIVASAEVPGRDTGAVHVWARLPAGSAAGRRAAYSWRHVQRLDIEQALPFVDSSSQCGASLALHHQSILVGCPGFNNRSGLALMFQLSKRGTWEHTWTFNPPQTSGTLFGDAVAMDKAWVVVGAPDMQVSCQANTSSEQGSVSIFHQESSAWSLFSHETGAAAFGAAVAIKGNNVVIGSPLEHGRGAVDMRIFIAAERKWKSPTVSKLRPISVGSYGSDTCFGSSVALSENHLVAAALDTNVMKPQGVAYVYYYSDLLTFYVPQDRLAADDALAWSPGASQVLEPSRVAVSSAPAQVLFSGALTSTSTAGHGAYTFARQDRQDHWWGQVAKIRPLEVDSTDDFGAAVAISGAVGVISAPGDDSAGVDAGALYFIVPANATLQFATLPWHMLYDKDGESYLGATFVCPSGEFEADTVFVGTSGSCQPCSSGACPSGHFEAAQCNAKRDRQCQVCSPPCTAGMIESLACSTEHDRSCVPVSSESAAAVEAGGVEDCVILGLCEAVPPAQASEVRQRTPTLQKFDLVTLHEALQGDLWALHARWDTGYNSDPCTAKWYGVTCDTDLNVIALRLSSVRARGIIPSGFGEHLKSLRLLDLSNNAITGPFPKGLQSIKALRELNIAKTHFSDAGALQWFENMNHLLMFNALQVDALSRLNQTELLSIFENSGTEIHITQPPSVQS